ncbi:MAG: hypothetical protein NTY17_16535 [Planctomycetia bacterium]|nr:hypothetical protein [Planctomycetia bacterium]
MTTPDAGLPSPEPSAETPPEPVPPKKASKMSFLSSQMRATLATVAVIAVLGIGSLPWLMSSPARMSKLVADAVPALQAAVRFGSVKLGWLGPMVFEDIHIVPHDGSREPASIKRVELSHGLAGILLSLGDLGRVRVEGLEANVEFDADRNSNLKGLFFPALAGPGAAARPHNGKPGAVRVQLDVVGAVVRMIGPWADDPWVSDPINVQARLAPSADAMRSEWTVEPVQLLADARLEPAVAQGVLAYIAPVMAGATRTSGRFSLRINSATLPVSAAEGGRVSGVLAMHAVDLGPGPLAQRAIQSLPFNLPVPQSIRIADESHVEFQLADRRMSHKGLAFGVPLAKPGQRLDIRSSGSVGLDDKTLQLKLELPIPADLPQDRPLLAALSGRTFSVGVGGFLGEPRIDFDGSLRANAGGVVAELIDRLRSPGGPQAARQPVGPPRPLAPPAPAWKPDASAGKDSKTTAPDAAKPTAVPTTVPSGDGANADARQQAGAPATADKIKSALPPDMKTDPTAEAVIDLVGGWLGEVAKRRAERQAAEAANPQQPQPSRGRLLRRLMQPQASPQATPPAATLPLQPVPPPAE